MRETVIRQPTSARGARLGSVSRFRLPRSRNLGRGTRTRTIDEHMASGGVAASVSEWTSDPPLADARGHKNLKFPGNPTEATPPSSFGRPNDQLAIFNECASAQGVVSRKRARPA